MKKLRSITYFVEKGIKMVYYNLIRPVLKRIYYFTCISALRALSFLLFWVRPKKLDAGHVRKLLVVKLERIGDLVLSVPAIHALKRKFPESHITLVVNPYTKAIVSNDPSIDEIIVFDSNGPHSGFRGKMSLLGLLRSRRFDVAIDLSTRDFFFLPVWLTCLSGAHLTLGLDNFARGFLFNIKVKPKMMPRPLSEEVLHILSPLNVTTSELRPELFLSEEDRHYIKGYLESEGITETDTLVCVHNSGFFKTQHWVKEGYSEVARHLIKRYHAKVFFVGSENEKTMVNEIINMIHERPFNLAGEISLGQLMALISRCHLFIGSSSGPLHIAVGLNIPTVSILGPTVPERWNPQESNHIILRKDLPCSPCESGHCWKTDYACMRHITVQEVISATDRQLESRENNFSSASMKSYATRN
jgi:lipopolysaccharide heptosyltransferase II